MIRLAVSACPGPVSTTSQPGQAVSIGRVGEGCGTMPQLMFDSDDPAVLADPMFNDCRVATYADLLTPEIVNRFAGRLAVIDRGKGDPMSRAHIADIEPGALSQEEGAAKCRQWVSEGRRYVTAYVNRSERDAVKALLGSVPVTWWVATLDGNMNVDDQYTAIVQFAGEAVLGKHVDISIVYHTGWLEMGTSSNTDAVRTMQNYAVSLQGLAQEIVNVAKVL